MSDMNRGLALSDLTGVTDRERSDFGDFYKATLGHTHVGLEFWLDEQAADLKRYRRFSDVATPNNYESSRKVFVFGFLPFYAVIGYDVGVRYLVHTRQRMGMTKSQILEGIAISFLVMGPAGMETVAKALADYDWIEPEQPAEFPAGWAPDPGAFESGQDYDSPSMSQQELESLHEWYLANLGEIPRYVRFLGTHRPALLKAYRQRYENCTTLLPKQLVPTTLLHYNVIRGFRAGIRENVLLARAFGVGKEITLNTIGSAALNGGMDAVDIVDEAAGDVFANWDSPTA